MMPASTSGIAPPMFAAAALALAATHLLGGRLTFLDRIPRSQWLSFGGGVSVAYVFVHLLPELGGGSEAVSELLALGFVERHVYLVAMVGFVAFYGLERLAVRSRDRDGGDGGTDDERTDDDPGDGDGGDDPDGSDDSGRRGSEREIFWIHIGSFGLYNVLVGYTLHHREDVASLALFTVAMALHFVVNDYGLRRHHGRLYHDVGRWVVSAAVVVGTGLAFVYPLGDALFTTVVAFLSGGIVLNVIKEELPEKHESRFRAFAAGAFAYTALLLLV